MLEPVVHSLGSFTNWKFCELNTERQRMANSLYQLEEQVFELEDLVKQVEKNLRKEELSALGLLR